MAEKDGDRGPDYAGDGPDWLTLEKIIPLESRTRRPTVEELTSLSVETIEREFSQYIVWVSENRRGMKLRHVLAITDGTAERRTSAKETAV